MVGRLVEATVRLVRRHPVLFRWVWAAGLVALAPLSLLPQTSPPTGIGGVELSLDQVFHVIAYGGLSGLAMLIFDRARSRNLAVAFVLLVSAGYETGQLFVPGRSFGWDDLWANLLGGLLGYGLGVVVLGRPVPGVQEG